MVQELKDGTSGSQNIIIININLLTDRWEFLVLPPLSLTLESSNFHFCGSLKKYFA
jgi:hypothetical protein